MLHQQNIIVSCHCSNFPEFFFSFQQSRYYISWKKALVRCSWTHNTRQIRSSSNNNKRMGGHINLKTNYYWSCCLCNAVVLHIYARGAGGWGVIMTYTPPRAAAIGSALHIIFLYTPLQLKNGNLLYMLLKYILTIDGLTRKCNNKWCIMCECPW